mgnify:CR=1 FL=1
MKTKNYSFYSENKRSFVQVKATSKRNVCIYAKNVLKEDINNENISIMKTGNSHQSQIEVEYPELFS